MEMLAGLGRKENEIKEAGYPTESLVGWRKELEAKLLEKMPQTTLQARPYELAATLPSAFTAATTALSTGAALHQELHSAPPSPELTALATSHINRTQAQPHMVPVASRTCIISQS